MLSEILEAAQQGVIENSELYRNSEVILLSDAMIFIGQAFEAGLEFKSNN